MYIEFFDWLSIRHLQQLYARPKFDVQPAAPLATSTVLEHIAEIRRSIMDMDERDKLQIEDIRRQITDMDETRKLRIANLLDLVNTLEQRVGQQRSLKFEAIVDDLAQTDPRRAARAAFSD
jgi:hypothetical protein